MYLLIQTSFEISRMPDKFTSHYVSINSTTTTNTTTNTDIFTSHYVSINSIMSVRILDFSLSFTSHYVSINSDTATARHSSFRHLHPTMYLLIPLTTYRFK